MVIEKEYLRQINKETRRFGRYAISVQDIEKVLGVVVVADPLVVVLAVVFLVRI